MNKYLIFFILEDDEVIGKVDSLNGQVFETVAEMMAVAAGVSTQKEIYTADEFARAWNRTDCVVTEIPDETITVCAAVSVKEA